MAGTKISAQTSLGVILGTDTIPIARSTTQGTAILNGSSPAFKASTNAAGNGAGIIRSSGVIDANLTTVGNIGAGEDDLISYTLLLNSLSSSTKGVRIFAWGSCANNANSKTVQTYVGGTSILSTTLLANTAQTWESTVLLFSTGTGAQKYFANLIRFSGTSVDTGARVSGTLTKDETANIIIKYTGTATADNDITQAGMLTEFFN